MSLQSEAVRCHGAVIDRIAIFRAKTSKAAYETETKVVKALAAKCLPIGGRREFFDGVSFEEACLVTSESAGVPVWVDVGVQRQAA